MIYHFFVLVPLFLFLDNNLQMLKIFLKNDFIKSYFPEIHSSKCWQFA